MDWMLMPLRRYADFVGRSQRKEYWMFILGYAIVYALLGLVGVAIGSPAPFELYGGAATGMAGVLFWLMAVIGLVLFIPSLAVTVRRFHDQDRSGWWILIGLIPYLGGLIIIVFMCIDGTPGPNRFGLDPKEFVPVD